MYDFYLSKEENNYYKKGENAMFTTVNGEKVTEIFDLPATTQKSYNSKAKVIVTQEGKYLLSYNTIVCGVLSNGCFVKLWDDWSSTTAKHINDFMRVVHCGNGFNKKEWNKLECFITTGVIYTYEQIVS